MSAPTRAHTSVCMTISDLIKRLSQFPPECPVLVRTDELDININAGSLYVVPVIGADRPKVVIDIVN